MLKKEVIEHFKKITSVATVLDLSPAAVSQWGPIVPEKNAYRLQEITNGKLKIDRSLYKNKNQIVN